MVLAGVAGLVQVATPVADNSLGFDSLLRRVEHDFAYHPPRTDETVKAHETVRFILGACAKELVKITPMCREQSVMITQLEQAMFWANAAIARTAAEPAGAAATSSQ